MSGAFTGPDWCQERAASGPLIHQFGTIEHASSHLPEAFRQPLGGLKDGVEHRLTEQFLATEGEDLGVNFPTCQLAPEAAGQPRDLL